MEDRGGRLELLLPYATLEPVRELLLQMFMGEKFGRDSIWENHLASELWLTDVQLGAVLDEVTVGLRDVLNWKVGSRLMLNTQPDGLVELRCGRSEEHTSELQSLMRISYAVFCLKKKKNNRKQ